MKPPERLTHRVTFGAGIIVGGAMTCLALTSTSARPVGPVMHAAAAVDVAAATAPEAEGHGIAHSATRTEVQPALPSAKDVRGASPYAEITNEPAPRLIVEPPLPGPLAQGVAFIPYRVENLRILPVGGAAARDVSPRVGHLHITVDDLPWQWADYGQSNTVILVGMPRGQHKVLIQVVDPEGNVFTGQTVTFNSPGKQGP